MQDPDDLTVHIVLEHAGRRWELTTDPEPLLNDVLDDLGDGLQGIGYRLSGSLVVRPEPPCELP